MTAQNGPQSEKPADLRSVHTSNLPELFDQLGISLIVSTYQAGKAIVVRSDTAGSTLTSEHSPSRWVSWPTLPG
jgi:hypothetical protein